MNQPGYAWGIGGGWAVAAVGAALWLHHGRSWASLGFSVPEGWRLWVCTAVVLLLAGYYAFASVAVARDPEARASARRQLGDLPDVAPHTRSELAWFAGVSLTAGFCEEFLFRGYLLRALAPALGAWGAAALSVLLFAAGHAYQGWNGVLRTGIAGACFMLVVAVFGSLWPAIALHVVVDLGAGVIGWLARREERAQVEAPAAPEP